jgi:PAS domain S-box-containing protein
MQEVRYAGPPASEGSAAQDTLKSFLRAALNAAEALAELHRSGLIHQNIRPQTLRIDPLGEGVELTGADLGQLPEPSALALPIDALPYLAPEQTGRLEGAIDLRADLYSLGIVLYELRAGALPFHADDPLGWVHCHLARAPRPLAEASPGTPAVVSDIIMKLLAKPPDDRYQSARGLSHDLQRCLEELSTHGRVEPFPLGARDVWDKLRAANRTYGRSEELATLREAVERIRATGCCEVALVAGPSGIGKSALVRELQRHIGSMRAAFLWGKFEETKREVPYSTIGQAFQDLLRQTLASTDAELAAIREQLKGALGESGQLIIDLVPQIELVIGKQPPVPALPASEASHRFHLAFRSFLGVFATRERPLILFLDDMQWADFATLELMQHIVTHPDLRSLLVIGAYRDDEVDASHPLEATLGAIRSAGVPCASIKLAPLSRADLIELVVDMFHCERDEAQPLVALLWAKTSGNPFFAAQLLSALHQDQLIHFDTQTWSWQWDIAQIEAEGITNDMVELVLGKLRRLPEATLDVLKLAACAGSEFSVRLLGTLCSKTPEEVRASLEPALQEGLLLQRAQGYKFLHDRVLEAAYSLIPEGERAGLHLRFGRLLLEHTPEDALDGLLFDIVNQLDLGAGDVEAADERRQIAVINLRAGRKAKAASAARSAATYFAKGIPLLPEDSWDTDYALTYGLHLELGECEFLSGRFEEVERLCGLLKRHARNSVDRASIARLEIQLATAQGDNARAVEVGLASLHLLGVELPRDANDSDVKDEIGWVRDKLREQGIEELINLPEMADPDMIAVMGVISVVYPAALYTAPNLADVALVRMVRLSILHGNAPASPHGYVNLGNILCSRFGDFRDGYRLGKLACDLGQRPGFGSYSAEAFVGLGAVILSWSRHMREAIDLFRMGFRSARDSGKLIYAASGLIQSAMFLFAMGEPLSSVYEASEQAFEFTTNAKYAFLADIAGVLQRLSRTLRGDTERFGSLSEDGADEDAFDTHMREGSIPMMRVCYYVYKLAARFWAGDYAGAHAAAKEAEGLLWSARAMLVEAEYCLYAALTAAALHDGAGEAERGALRGQLSAFEEQLRIWAESCPDNFSSRYALVSAEIARIDGRAEGAAVLYDQAISASRDGGFVQIEGLACEIAGRFYLRRAFKVVPAAYLREARACYARWGARGKVRQLEARHADLLAEPRRESTPLPSADAEPIDTLTAAKASAAISSEMAPDELLATLMRILIEHAGAQRSCLLLPSRDGFSVAAEITSNHDDVRVETPKVRRAPLATELSLSMAHYVRRTREKLILDDVTASVMFPSDVHLSTARPRSLLCAPIVRRGEIAGILYLENRLTRGAFTPRRLALLEFLAAVSLENALLAADLARETGERTQTEKTLRQSEERLQRLVETANVVPWEAERGTGQLTYVGPQVVKMLGYPQDAWLSAGFLGAHVHPHDRESTLMSLVAPSSDAPSSGSNFDFRMTAADGRSVWLHNVVSSQGPAGAGVLGGFLFDITERKEAEAKLKEQLDIIEAQQAAIRKLSTPIIEVWEGVLTMPVLGVVNESRALQMMTVLLEAVKRTASRYTIIDLTGAEAVDAATADHIMRIVRAVQLLGAKSIIVGIRPEVAQTIVAMAIDMSSIVTLSNLREALLLCMSDQRGRRERWQTGVKS